MAMRARLIRSVARRYVNRWLPERTGVVDIMERLSRRALRLDEGFCREVADHFAAQPPYTWGPELARRYALLQTESMRQYEAIVAAGVRIEPWLGGGQPYDGSRHLRDSVLATGTLAVYLTRDGHGPSPSDVPHPMRGSSGVRCNGVELSHNDIFRAVHDVFGHVMFGHSMGPAGEFRATYCHMAMYSDEVHPVLFSEQISQICWFFYGPHLRVAAGRLPGRDEPGWVPPPARPYAEQKVFDCPQWFVERFKAGFGEESP
jgi:hypothetical protein